MLIGYARVSKKDQNLDLQLHALTNFGCKRIFREKVSGRSKYLPELEAALKKLKRGDTLVFWHLDRLGRNAREMLNLEYELSLRCVKLVSLTDHIDTSTPDGVYHFQTTCAYAQRESARIGQRTKAGMQAAKLRGVKFGRKRVLNEKQRQMAKRLSATKKISLLALAKKFKVGKTTVWRALHE
jgi:DNA invertase Pin-like site-specific DNA recombinase